MARTKKTTKKASNSKRGRPPKRTEARLSKVVASKKTPASTSIWLDRIKADFASQQSPSSFILGALIVVVVAILVFNYFSGPSKDLASPQTDSQMTQNQTTSPTKDASKDNLPGKYTVKDGDTLFSIAQNYYNNGYLYQKIADTNHISDPNSLTTGQVLNIPKLTEAELNSTPTPSPEDTTDPQMVAGQSQTDVSPPSADTVSTSSQTPWGAKIDSTTYTVQQGDWLSKIAGRAYGNIYQYDKIAKANNIPNPNLIEPGMVLTIPR